MKTSDHPEGGGSDVFEGIKAAIIKDRYAHFDDFLDNFYNTDTFAPDRVSDRARHAALAVSGTASPAATYARVDTWLTDFRDDLPKIDVSMLAVHGAADRILPYDATARRLPGLIMDLRLVTVDAGPDNIGWTHPDEVNTALLEFLAA